MPEIPFQSTDTHNSIASRYMEEQYVSRIPHTSRTPQSHRGRSAPATSPSATHLREVEGLLNNHALHNALLTQRAQFGSGSVPYIMVAVDGREKRDGRYESVIEETGVGTDGVANKDRRGEGGPTSIELH